jgi:hypothetical protein
MDGDGCAAAGDAPCTFASWSARGAQTRVYLPYVGGGGCCVGEGFFLKKILCGSGDNGGGLD